MLNIGFRNQHALNACQPARLADFEETLDLLVDATNGLHLTSLIDRAGHGQVLPQGDVRKCGHQRKELGGGGAVAFYSCIGLLEDETREQGHWLVQRIPTREKTRQDQHALGVDWAAKLDFPFDIYNLAGAWAHTACDSGRSTKSKAAQFQNAKSVDL